jgi:hypothetical protein
MSAALQLPLLWGEGNTQPVVQSEPEKWEEKSTPPDVEYLPAKPPSAAPVVSVAFYRRHTENVLRRYLYASLQVGRAPSILGDPIGRGWCSSRPVRTFEDAVIFVLDVERCLNQLGLLDRRILARVILQEYTHHETASMLGMSARSIAYKLPEALDRLTERLLDTGLLVIPH